MKKFLAIFLFAAMCICMTSCGDKSESDPVQDGPQEITPAYTQEKLKEMVDFEAAEKDDAFITAEKGEITISSDPAPVLSEGFDGTAAYIAPSSLRSETAPTAETVWQDTPIGMGNDKFTLPDAVLMKDGSLGNLSIPKIGLNVPIYETDDEIEAMAHGVAHMKETSCWTGNVGLAGHNAGVNTYFANIHKLSEGDKIQLTTALGTKNYVVTANVEISEMDWSYLNRTDDNRITLITCVNYDGTKRLCVQAVEAQ